MGKLILTVALLLVGLTLPGCGGGGGGGSGGSTVVAGGASKGHIISGSVRLFTVESSQLKPITDVLPVTAGSFTANLGSYTGPVVATLSSGGYIDEATGIETALSTELHAATFVSAPGPITLVVTPLTEIAFRKMTAEGLNNLLNATLVHNTNAAVSNAFLGGSCNITATLPANVLSTATGTYSSTELTYGLMLASVSQIMASNNQNLPALLDNATEALSISGSSGSISSEFKALLQAAAEALGRNAHLKQSWVNLPTELSVSVSKGSAVADGSDSISIVAEVKRFGGCAVADGTVVDFDVAAAGATLSSTSMGTVGGSATVTLQSVQPGPVTVRVSAGELRDEVALSFLAAPPQATTALVKLAVDGVLPQGTLIGSIDAVLRYPADRGLAIATDQIVLSGSGAVAGSMFAGNPEVAGEVRLGLVNPTGIGAGEFATLSFAIAAGNAPAAADFTLSQADTAVHSSTGQPLANRVVIQGVAFQ